MSGVRSWWIGGNPIGMDFARYLRDRFGDRPLLVESGGRRTWTGASLDAEAEKWAGLLSSRGVTAGGRVAVLAPNEGAVVALLFGCWRVGAALAPLHHRLAAAELREELERLRPGLLVVGRGFEERAREVESVSAPTVPLSGTATIEATEPPGIVRTAGEATGLILPTGGSTGRPKSAEVSVRALVSNALNTASAWDLRTEDSGLAAYPFFHTGGWNVLTLPLLSIGGESRLLDRPDPHAILEEILRGRVTVLSAVPTTLMDLVELEGFPQAPLDRLRFVKSGGGPSPAWVVERFRERGVPFYQGYGLTEAGPNLFYSSRDDLERPGTVGRPTPLAELALRTEDGRDADEGELWVRGPLVFSGYLGAPEGSEAARVDGWVATGDVLRRDKDDFYYFVGRRKQMFKSGGENVYPTEVEAVLETHPAVRECAVVGVPDPRWGEVGCAFVRTSADVPDEELVVFLRARLAHFKVPRRFVRVSGIPRTAAGKKDYPRLPRTGAP